MATKVPTDEEHVGARIVGTNDVMSVTETETIMMELPAHPPAVPHVGGGGGGGGKNVNKRLDKMKPGSHVIMFNQSGVPTVVSSGGSGHVQHVSVVGHVQHVSVPYEGGIAVGGSEADELTAKKKASSFKITNVYLSRPPSNDGDDSCDDNEDLEDSHTEVQVLSIVHQNLFKYVLEFTQKLCKCALLLLPVSDACIQVIIPSL